MHNRRARVAALAALAVLVAVPVAVHAFFTGEQPVRVGAHTATTSPTLDGHGTVREPTSRQRLRDGRCPCRDARQQR